MKKLLISAGLLLFFAVFAAAQANLPDLKIEKPKVSATEVSFEIANKGGSEAGASYYQVSVDGKVIEEEATDPIGQGQNRKIIVDLNTGVQGDPAPESTSSKIKIVVDSKKAVKEKNENNNVYNSPSGTPSAPQGTPGAIKAKKSKG